MRGKNPKRPPVQGDGHTLDVQEIFATLQGEGPYVGWPAVFIRLGGCNLACEFCDTQFESFQSKTLEAIVTDAHMLAAPAHIKLVVITGGEPFRQPIALLCGALVESGFKVQIETNGTLYREISEEVDIVCSPKVANGSYHPVRSDLLKRANALKFLISAHMPEYADVPDVGQQMFGTPIYVQPMDEYDVAKNKANRALALNLAKQHGYRLSLQMHKILEIP